MTDLVLTGLRKTYGDFVALDSTDLTVEQGEFLTLLGPSGCGKSTTLAAIAGLDVPSGGRITFQGRDLYNAETGLCLPPEARNFGVVFQSYALWPHMTVEKNVSMPLELRRVPAAERRARVAETLELVGLAAFARRYPGELSGGQQQRVALARAIVFKPPLLLLDEPLSNLDAQLRLQARSWLKDIQRSLGLTTIYVTHDQEEALAMSDRIVVMKQGRIVQMGRPEDIYGTPLHPFSAQFVGSANLLEAELLSVGDDGLARVRLPNGPEILGHAPLPLTGAGPVSLVLRPERIGLAPVAGPGPVNEIIVQAGAVSYLGEGYEQVLDLAGQSLRRKGERAMTEGPGRIQVAAADLLVFRKD
ncbi:ABC transporter ATP-binding protein [Xinfangfangia pollutisoli]|uniref:ABC transporter ATP-binding protein n=1 Tax=Xinfangfangia pollutisoli TaxID=2865960 RepID=UPI001CD49D7A|nr:ABC transporter ATP-binding protein [Xinfangfangia pollutisoli]